MTETLVLREGMTTRCDSLSAAELQALRALVPGLGVSPASDGHGIDLTPGPVIGALQIGARPIVIRPKIAMAKVLFLVSYALNPRMFRQQSVTLDSASDFTAAIAPMFLHWAHHATSRGLLQGYVAVSESSMTVRGRIRFDDQIRRRGSLPLPIEISYDDYTEDIVENRLLKAATHVLRRLPLRSDFYSQQLRGLDARLQSVTLARYRSNRVPDPAITRLNHRYEAAIQLARLVLNHSSVELLEGGMQCTSLLFNMNKVFEDFLTVALRESLGLTSKQFPQGAYQRRLRLDQNERVRLKPDLSWWVDDRPVFVGDAKYKRISVAGIEHADLYQLLAYTVAMDLPSGLLIYAAGEADEVEHVVAQNGKRLLVRTLDIGQSPVEILTSIDNLADLIRIQARQSIFGTQSVLEHTS